jgi:hypothetical protein
VYIRFHIVLADLQPLQLLLREDLGESFEFKSHYFGRSHRWAIHYESPTSFAVVDASD